MAKHIVFDNKCYFVHANSENINVAIFYPLFSTWLFITEIVREPNCLDLIFAASPYEKVIIVPDTNYITSAIRKFMLDMPSPGSFQNIGLLI